MIAEDDQPIATVIAALVEDMGHTPLVARNGGQALAMAREQQPALLITDLMMPVLDGAGLIAALRAEHADGVPVILLTAAPRAQAQAAGADVVLPKPFDLIALEELISEILDVTPRSE
ncbi:MAG TPA: response regulator [Chloroflexota bacterium]|nr:response regulator [Chloroflexota bacterium]